MKMAIIKQKCKAANNLSLKHIKRNQERQIQASELCSEKEVICSNTLLLTKEKIAH